MAMRAQIVAGMLLSTLASSAATAGPPSDSSDDRPPTRAAPNTGVAPIQRRITLGPPPPERKTPKDLFVAGVKAQAPRPILGRFAGVRAGLPGPIGGHGSLLDRRLPIPGEPEDPESPRPPRPTHPIYLYPGYWYSDYFDYGYTVDAGYSSDPFVLDGLSDPARMKPVTPVVARGTERPACERAEEAFRRGELDEAGRLFREHLKADPSDVESWRLLGLVLLDQGKVSEGVETMYAAYKAAPRLVRQPLVAADVPGGATEMLKRRGKALGYAGMLGADVDHAAGFFVGAVLAQAEGRADVALRLLEKAEKAGLSRPLAEEARLVLAPAGVRAVH